MSSGGTCRASDQSSGAGSSTRRSSKSETVTPTLLVGQFVDADACQAGQPAGARLGVGAGPAHDRPTVRHVTRTDSLTTVLTCAPPTTPPDHRRHTCVPRRGGPRHPRHGEPVLRTVHPLRCGHVVRVAHVPPACSDHAEVLAHGRGGIGDDGGDGCAWSSRRSYAGLARVAGRFGGPRIARLLPHQMVRRCGVLREGKGDLSPDVWSPWAHRTCHGHLHQVGTRPDKSETHRAVTRTRLCGGEGVELLTPAWKGRFRGSS
jgi:hypothetical protein